MNEYTGKYYVIEITKYVDGSPDAKGIYSYETETEALANFHSKLGGAMKNSNYAFELVQVINEYGVVIESKYFERKAETEETETE